MRPLHPQSELLPKTRAHTPLGSPTTIERLDYLAEYANARLWAWNHPETPESASPELKARVAELLAPLTKRQREVVELVWMEGVSPGCVAELLGLTPAVVYGRLYKARAAMKTNRRPAKCGTRGAYLRHRRHRERPCQPCMEANRAYHRERWATVSEQERMAKRERKRRSRLKLKEIAA